MYPFGVFSVLMHGLTCCRWLLCGAMEVVKLGFISSGSHTTQSERPYLLLTTVTSLAILSIMLFPAFYRLMCLRTDDGSCCCTRRARRTGYSTTANESFEGTGDDEEDASLALHADTQLPGFLTAGAAEWWEIICNCYKIFSPAGWALMAAVGVSICLRWHSFLCACTTRACFKSCFGCILIRRHGCFD